MKKLLDLLLKERQPIYKSVQRYFDEVYSAPGIIQELERRGIELGLPNPKLAAIAQASRSKAGQRIIEVQPTELDFHKKLPFALSDETIAEIRKGMTEGWGHAVSVGPGSGKGVALIINRDNKRAFVGGLPRGGGNVGAEDLLAAHEIKHGLTSGLFDPDNTGTSLLRQVGGFRNANKKYSQSINEAFADAEMYRYMHWLNTGENPFFTKFEDTNKIQSALQNIYRRRLSGLTGEMARKTRSGMDTVVNSNILNIPSISSSVKDPKGNLLDKLIGFGAGVGALDYFASDKTYGTTA